MRLEPRTPGLRVKHLTTEPRGTLTDLKESIKDNLKFIEIGSKFSKGIENSVGKGENARYDHYTADT